MRKDKQETSFLLQMCNKRVLNNEEFGSADGIRALLRWFHNGHACLPHWENVFTPQTTSLDIKEK